MPELLLTHPGSVHPRDEEQSGLSLRSPVPQNPVFCYTDSSAIKGPRCARPRPKDTLRNPSSGSGSAW